MSRPRISASLDFHGRIAKPLVGFTPQKLADGTLRARYSALKLIAETAKPVIIQNRDFNVGLGQLLAKYGIFNDGFARAFGFACH